jgi:hypothetical protein
MSEEEKGTIGIILVFMDVLKCDFLAFRRFFSGFKFRLKRPFFLFKYQNFNFYKRLSSQFILRER